MNNEGVSLIEVIVSITILAIVLVPVLQILSTSVYYNIKARTKQNQTMTAQTLMEDFKGYGVEALYEMFPREGQVLTEEQKEQYRTQISEKLGITLKEESIQNVKLLNDSGQQEYTFYITGLMQENQKEYDAKLELTPLVSQNRMFSVTDFSATRDGIYREDMGLNQLLQDKILNDFQQREDGWKSFRDEYNGLNRKNEEKLDIFSDFDTDRLQLKEKKMTYTLSKNDDKVQAVAHLEISYCISDYPFYVLADEEASDRELENGEDSHETIFEEEFLSYPVEGVWSVEYDLNGDEAGNDLILYQNDVKAGFERLWIFYYPYYDTEVKDTVLVQNQIADKVLECYLIKQRQQEISDGALKVKEARYQPYVSRIGTGAVVLYHNLNMNLGDDSFMAMPSSVSSESFIFENHFMNAGKLHEDKVLLYQCKLQILEAGTDHEVASMEGTMRW